MNRPHTRHPDQTPDCDSPGAPIRCITIDVEEYFQIEAAYPVIGPSRWDDWPSRVEPSMDSLLELFERTGCRATFFFLGSIAQRHPHLARRCVKLGHEVGSHGSMHDRLHRLTPNLMRRDVLDSKHLLEDQIGRPVLGYRAPTWSVTRQTSWAVDVLIDAGFRYDASVFPVNHPNYGVPEAPDRPYYVKGFNRDTTLLEIPPLTWRLAGRNIAVAGGGYFRLLPLSLMRRGLMQAARQKRPAVLYFHPWEFDPELPCMPLGLAGRVRTYTGLKSAKRRLEQIIRQYSENIPGQQNAWCPIAEHLDTFESIARQTGVFTLRPQAAA
ncbi:MAG: DUF3473 domain-containing protein [Phycisphaeraceae bacterium]